MPLQNRVMPTGDIVAISARGSFMGNRGILHDEHQQLGTRRWAHKAWLICRTSFRGRHRKVMSPRRYTELFFFDEASAIAAGHRPCHECRRHDFLAWQTAWQQAQSLDTPPRAPEMDAQLHGDRIETRQRRQRRWLARFGDLPDGAFVLHDGDAHLVHNSALRAWSWHGYQPAIRCPADSVVTVITPSLSVAVLQFGYRPAINFSHSALKVIVDSDN